MNHNKDNPIKTNNAEIKIFCKEESESCIGYRKRLFGNRCVFLSEGNECLSRVCRVNKMMLLLKSEGIKVNNG